MSPIKLGGILFHHVLVVLLGRRNFTPFLDLLYMSLNKITNFLKKRKEKKRKVQPIQMLQQCVLIMPKGIKKMSNYWPNKINISFFDVKAHKNPLSNITHFVHLYLYLYLELGLHLNPIFYKEIRYNRQELLSVILFG